MNADTMILPGDGAAEAEARVGGKALGLQRLRSAGAAVPPFCVVATEAFAAHLRRGRLGDDIGEALGAMAALDPARDLAELERRAEALRARIEAEPLDEALAAALRAALPALGPGPYAVRSSMVGEDSASRSFAGQLDTFLYQPAAEVPRAVLRCWSSAFTARALGYRARGGELAALPRMGVVVQRMIGGRVSGVLFTANPVSGRRDQALLSACWGLGEGVVSGRCNSDEFVWGHDGREFSCTIADKDLAVAPAGAAGTAEVPVPEARRRVRCVTPEEATELVREGLRLAAALGAPQDIEWTLSDEGLYLLQARPITALGATLGTAPSATPANSTTPGAAHHATATAAAGEAAGPEVVWDNSNIQESYCGVTTPLTFSFARGAYADVYEQVMRIARRPESEIAAMRPVLQDLLGLLCGRVYYNINNWYRMLQRMPSFKRNKQDMERMMGLEEPVDFVTGEDGSLPARLARVPTLLAIGAQMLLRFRGMEAEVARFTSEFDAAYQRIHQRRPRFGEASFSELMDLLRQVRQDLLGRWHTPIINDIHVMMTSGRLRRLVEGAVGAEAAPRLLSNLMGGEEGIESTEPTRMLLRLGAAARRDPALRAALADGAASLPSLRAAQPAFAAELDRYIERYGDRVMGELKLETVTLREDPSFLLRLLRGYLDRGDLDAQALADKERRLRRESEAELRAALGTARFRRAEGTLRAARAAVKHRENMRLLRTRLFGLVRDLYRAIGERLREAGRLDEARDVFYLTVEEIDAYHRGTAVSADTAALARARRAEYAAYEALELPHRVVTRGPVYHGNLLGAARAAERASGDPGDGDGGARLLRGTGCYPGVVSAPARVILRPSDDIDLQGRILVTLRTDPGWAPLFPLCSGILVERGSTLSHSAILARELGIPAIVGVPGLLRCVRDGEALRLDGGAGTVERLGAQGRARS